MRNPLRIVISIFGMCILAIIGALTIARQGSAESRWVAYYTLDGDLLVVRRDGMIRRKLVMQDLTIYDLEWSPDGLSVLAAGVMSVENQYLKQIFRIKAESGAIMSFTSLDEISQVESLEVSSDGQWIYYSGRNSNSESWCNRVRLDLSITENLIGFSGRNQGEVIRCWPAPNGNELAVTVFDYYTENTDLYLVEIQNKAQRKVVDNLTAITGGKVVIDWSPDSLRLLISGPYAGDPIRFLPINPPNKHPLLFPRRSYLGQGSATWSPDGEWIVFLGTHRNKVKLYCVRSDGSDEKILYEGNTYGTEPQWSANGHWIAMGVPSSNSPQSQTFDLMIFEADGSAPPKRIAERVAPSGSVVWSPPLDIAWSKGGLLIGGIGCIIAAWVIRANLESYPRR